MSLIRLHCPSCKKTGDFNRASYDPHEAIRADILCPECCDRLNALEPETVYFDESGKQVLTIPEARSSNE